MPSLGRSPLGMYLRNSQRGLRGEFPRQADRQTDTSDGSRQSTDVCLGVPVPEPTQAHDFAVRGSRCQRQDEARLGTLGGGGAGKDGVGVAPPRRPAGTRCLQLPLAQQGPPAGGAAVGARLVSSPAGPGVSAGRDFSVLTLTAHHDSRRRGPGRHRYTRSGAGRWQPRARMPGPAPSPGSGALRRERGVRSPLTSPPRGLPSPGRRQGGSRRGPARLGRASLNLNLKLPRERGPRTPRVPPAAPAARATRGAPQAGSRGGQDPRLPSALPSPTPSCLFSGRCAPRKSLHRPGMSPVPSTSVNQPLRAFRTVPGAGSTAVSRGSPSS